MSRIKNRWPSRYSPKKLVSDRQYITELICENRAKSLNKDLPMKFWNLEEWKQYYIYQIKICDRLLRKYEATAIVNALKSQQGQKIYSLKVGWLENIIYAEQEKLNSQRKRPKKMPTIPPNRTPEFGYSNPLSVFDKLRELDT